MDKLIGLDFTPGGFRAVVARHSGRPTLVAADAIPIPGGIRPDGALQDPKAAAQKLKNWVDDNRLARTPAVFSVPNERAQISWTKLPGLEGPELYNVARYRLKKQFPRMSEHAVVAVAQPNGPESESLVIGVAREIIEQRAEILEHARLDPVGAEVEAQAVLRVIGSHVRSSGSLPPEASLTVAHIGQDRTQFVVLRGGRLGFMRTVKVGDAGIQKVVKKALAVTDQEAQTVLASRDTWLLGKRYIASVSDQFERIDALEAIEAFAKEFRRLIHYFRSIHPDRSYAGILDRLVLLGRVTQLRGFANALAEALGVRLEVLSPLVGLQIEADAEAFNRLGAESADFALAIGLAQAPYMAHLSQPQPDDHRDDQDEQPYAWTRAA